jgi:hypothetical protein
MTLCSLVDRHIAEECVASISLKKEAVYSSERFGSPANVHGVITQKTKKLIIAAMMTSNLTLDRS